MIFSLGLPAMAEEAAEVQVAYDTEAYEDALGLMNSLLCETVFGADPAAAVTRGQFVYGVAKIFSVPGVGADAVYSDVPAEHAYFGEISSAYNAGWISAAKKFNPDTAITLSEAVKIILCAADYEPMASAKGGYPTGYLTVAESIDLMDNINVGTGAQLLAADATIMFENLMLADVFEIESYGDTMDYRKGGEIYLEKLYDVYSVDGVITSTIYNSMVMDAPFIKENNEISIDGIAYRCTEMDPSMLGKKVTAYVSNKGTKKTLYCVIPEDNEEFTVRVNNFGGINGTTFTYYDEQERSKTKRLDSSYKVIYNGRRVSKIESYMFEDIGATVRLLENTGDSAYDVIFIDGYVYGYVTSVDYVNGYIGLKMPGSMVDLSDDDEHVCYIRNEEGAELELFELKSNQVIALKASADSRIYDITLCANSVSGAVTEMLADENIIKIGKDEYKVSQAFKAEYMEKALIDVGDSISAAIGLHGELVYLMDSSVDMSYAYLLDVNLDESGFDSTVMVKMYTMGGAFEIFELEEKLTVDGGALKVRREDVAGTLVDNKYEIIKYGVNDEGKISVIDFASTDTSNFGEKLNPQDTLTQYHDKDAGTLRYRSGAQGFNSKAILTNASIFFVPENEDNRNEEEKFSISSYSSLQSDTYYSCDVYDINEFGQAGLVVVYSDEESDPTAYTYRSYIIENVTNAIVDDVEGQNLYCWSNKAFHTLFLPGDVEVNKGIDAKNKKLASGDIVRLKVQGTTVKTVYVDYYFEDGKHVFTTTGGGTNTNLTTEANIAYVEGKVYAMNNATTVISNIVNEATGEYSFAYDNLMPYRTAGVIACYDTETGKVRPITAENVRTYQGYGDNADTIIMRQRYTTPDCIFVIR